MNALIELVFQRPRSILMIFVFILIAGSLAYINIPKESEPDITVPIIYVSMTHDGISPEDAERLLVRPMEKELQGISGVKKMSSKASEGHASVQLEFNAGFDNKKALADVRDKVDTAKAKLPEASDEPEVHEINVALFPVLTVSLSGSVPERGLIKIARDLQDKIEALNGVLEVDIGGDRESVMEVVVDPVVMETYNVSYTDLFNLIQNNNKLVAAGAIDSGAGRIVLKVPGVVESIEDILNMPVKVEQDRVVVFGDVAQIYNGFKDAEGYARVNGMPAVTLEVKKRVGANIINTISTVRALVAEEQQHWPPGLDVAFMQDKSNEIRDMLDDLQNNILSAILLVMIVILAVLGFRSALLVGVAIPGSFLATILILKSMDLTLNIVVLFSLILVVGMLVDGAIVVIELATRHLREGKNAIDAFKQASKRMAWPVIASTLTTLVVFLPLLNWPGMVGEFMQYLPMTVIIALSVSLAMALVFIPILGAAITKRSSALKPETTKEEGDDRFTKAYNKVLGKLLYHPLKTFSVAFIALILSYGTYAYYGKGVEFFPEVEPEFALIYLHARGDLSIQEKDSLVKHIEQRILDMEELKSIYARSFNASNGQNMAEDIVGVIQLELNNWQTRRKASVIMADIRERTQDIAGIVLEVRKQENGPSEGKPIQMEFSSRNPALIASAVSQVRTTMDSLGGFIDIEDNRPLPGIEWRLLVNREQAARYGADISILGNAVQMVTNGIKVSDYRPDDSDDEVDIRVRFPYSDRNLGQLDQLHVPTDKGMIPISNFVTIEPAQKTGTLSRVDAKRVITIQADVAEGILVDEKVTELRKTLPKLGLHPDVLVSFKGEDEDQKEAASFLSNAFVIAIFVMALVLVTQFNSFFQSFIVLSAIIFSTAGVLLGLLITAQPFGIVMVGLGIIALAGIVVNNNIVLIDTYNQLRGQGEAIVDAALETGRLRLRPVLLTAITTVLGLMPMVLAMNIDFIGREVSFGAPSTQWWTQLASAIAGGLSFATLLTLFLTPCLLVIGDSWAEKITHYLRTKKATAELNSEEKVLL